MAKTLLNNSVPHSPSHIFQQQTKTNNEHKTHGDVGKDKDAVSRVRQASAQPVILSNTLRTPPKITKSQRLQNRSTKRKLHQVAAWVDDPIILQLQDLARVQHLSMSQTVRGFLTEILRQKFHQQQAATCLNSSTRPLPKPTAPWQPAWPGYSSASPLTWDTSKSLPPTPWACRRG
jgi:hypothetical protein